MERGASARADRRVVTVLFADLSGFTALGERLDPEELTDLLRDCLAELTEEIHAREGWLEKQIGDALLAVFGAPVAHEDDPVRAVRAALAMRQRMAGVNARLQGRIGQPLSLHIGVNTGLVVMTRDLESGPGARLGELVVVGDTVNTAARLQQAAGPGQVFVGAATHAATNRVFGYAPLPPLSVKGKRGTLVAYECLRELPRPARGGPGVSARLIGRDGALAVIRACVDRVEHGSGGLVVVEGEAGLGKSRLVTEAGRDHDPQRLRWLQGNALPLTRGIRFWPFVELLGGFAGIGDGDAGDAGWAKLHSKLGGWVGDDGADIGLYLGVLLGLPLTGEREAQVRFLDADVVNLQVFRAVRRFLQHLAEQRPLVVVLEDWHWADDASVQLLEHLLPLTRAVPLLVVCTTRPQQDGPPARLIDAARREVAGRPAVVRLIPLSDAASAELAGEASGLGALPPGLREVVLRRAEGNPFFLEEIVRALVDLGLVRRGARGEWELSEAAGQAGIPDTVRGVIVARIDRLDEELKELLRVASVIGRSFARSLLQAIAEHDGDVDPRLRELQLLDLIRELRRVPELEYLFRHVLTQEAVYDSILLKRRRELHQAVARVIEQLAVGRGAELHGVLAFHYARAEDWENAERCLLAAGDQAGQVAADAEALEYYERALAAHDRLGADRWSPLQHAQLEGKIGEALYRRGRHTEALAHVRAALARLGAPFPESTTGIRSSVVIGAAGQAAWLLRGAPARAGGEADAAAVEIAHLYRVLCMIVFFTDPERYVLGCLRLARHARRHGVPADLATACAHLGMGWDALGQRGLGLRSHQRAVAVADRLGDPVVLALAQLCMGAHRLFADGDWPAAREHLERSAQTAWRTGDLRTWGIACQTLQLAHTISGELERGSVMARELARVGEDGGDGQIRAWGLVGLGIATGMGGRLAEAAALLAQAADMLRAVPDHFTLTIVSAWQALCELYQGHVQAAVAVLEEAERAAAELGLRGFPVTDLRQTRLEIAVYLAERAGPDERARALASARQASRAALSQGRADTYLLARTYRLCGSYEWLRGREQRARRWWQQAVEHAERTQTWYSAAAAHTEIGIRTGDREHLERGARMFAEMEVDLAALWPGAGQDATRIAPAP
ncbi:MAG TPA: AAA family ATPase [Streptosporangiaceae bacterium]|nr:AAA family ATPase [Streptosporangiaceae bacterium]